MSIASPQNRDEFKQHILMKLGAPVLQINVADEQLDIAINDAFQYYNERSHFYGTERMYLSFLVTREFKSFWRSFRTKDSTINKPKSLLTDPEGNLYGDDPNTDIMLDDGTTEVGMTARYQNNFLIMPDDVLIPDSSI